MSQEKTYEMQWDCQFCGATKLLGKTHRFCPTCGAPQDPDARYFPSDDEKVAVEDHRFIGTDTKCPACGTLNSASAVHCMQCGSPLEGGEKARTIKGGAWLAQGAAEYEESRDVAGEAFQREMAAAGVQTGEKKKRGCGGRVLGIIALVAVVLIGALAFLFTRTSEAPVVASAHEWTRTIEVETFSAVSDGDWRDQLPSAAYNTTCRERQRDTRRVQDGQQCQTVRRDNGDGTFTERQECEPTYREEPVMDTWCDYRIDRWEPDNAIQTTGNSLGDAPYWGETNFRCSRAQLGCQRESERDELYTVAFDAGGETYRCSFAQDEWAAISLGSSWSIEVRQLGGAICDSLAPQ